MWSALALIVAFGGTVWLLGGMEGFLYIGAFALLSAAGLPIGFALFGSRHAAGWIAGFLLGYAAITLAWWVLVVTGLVSTPLLVAAWAVVAAGSWTIYRAQPKPLVALSPWTRRDTTALLLLLLMVPALVGRPFDKLGSRDGEGHRLYRAYFIADFFWHTALTAELAKQEAYPVNPFLASEPLHYYWTYFRVPATVAAQSGMDIQEILKLNACATALLFLSAIYLAAWAALPLWPVATAIAVALTVLAPSIEGLASIVDLVRRGQPLGELRNLNIDAVAAWAFKGLRIDDLPRAMWYTPQHAFSCALGLLAVPVALGAGAGASVTAIVLVGCALGASLAFNPLLGVVFCAVYGLTILADAIHNRRRWPVILKHAIAIVPVALALAWCQWNQVGEGAADVLHFGFWGPARNATVLTFLLQFGPILLPIGLGLWLATKPQWPRLWPAVAGITLAVLLMHLVTLTVDQAWVGFRGGQIFFVLAPAIVALALSTLWSAGRRRQAIGLVLVVAALGLPTTIIDAYNIQDVNNRGFAPRNEFHWTVWITAPEQEALDWIRTHTPARSIVQMEPIVRGRETWSLIPTFAERRMASGVPLPLLWRQVYADNNARVRAIYESPDAGAAWQQARALGIDYLYVDRTERNAYPRVDKFDARPDLFERVFSNAEASVYALRP